MSRILYSTRSSDLMVHEEHASLLRSSGYRSFLAFPVLKFVFFRGPGCDVTLARMRKFGFGSSRTVSIIAQMHCEEIVLVEHVFAHIPK